MHDFVLVIFLISSGVSVSVDGATKIPATGVAVTSIVGFSQSGCDEARAYVHKVTPDLAALCIERK